MIFVGLTFLVIGVIAGTMVFFGIRSVIRYKLVQDTPTSVSVDVQEGLCEIKGKVEALPNGYFTSPFTDTPCVQYDAMVEKRVQSGKNSHWRTIFHERKGQGFLVRDLSGLTKVDTRGSNLKMVRTMNDHTSTFSGTSDRARLVLSRLGLPEKGMLGIFPLTYRIRESALPVHSDVYVLGTASERILEAELESNPLVNPCTIHKDKVLIISTENEETVASNLLMKGIFLIGGGVVVAAGGIFFVFTLISNLV